MADDNPMFVSGPEFTKQGDAVGLPTPSISGTSQSPSIPSSSPPLSPTSSQNIPDSYDYARRSDSGLIPPIRQPTGPPPSTTHSALLNELRANSTPDYDGPSKQNFSSPMRETSGPMSMLDSNPDSDADDDGRGNTPLETILHRRRTIQMRARQNGRTPLPGAPRERQRTPPLPGIAPIGAERSGPSKELQAGLKSSIKGKKLIGTIGDGRVEDAEVAERTHIYYPQ